MANWVRDYLRDHPEHAALPIHKQAQHSIHFRNPDNSITAIFTGAPMHYEESPGVFKPLDTALVPNAVAGDYGALGLRPRLKLDHTNTVGVYSQRTTRVGLLNTTTMAFTNKVTLPNGHVEDDCIVSGGTWWEHRLRLTETGLRETLTILSNPGYTGAASWLVLDTIITGRTYANGEITTVESLEGYTFPLPTTTDANSTEAPTKRWARRISGVQHIYTGIQLSWLATAVYPVVIDPDYLDSTNDAYVTGYYSGDYAEARATSTSYDVSAQTLKIGQQKQSSNYSTWRAYLLFDTSGIGADNTVTQVNLVLRLYQKNNYSGRDPEVNIIKQDWSSQSPMNSAAKAETAYDGCLTSSEDSNIWKAFSAIAGGNSYTSGNLSTNWISKTGTTYYSLATNKDYDGSGSASTDQEWILVCSEENTVAGYRPVLTVSYESAATNVEVLAVTATASAAALVPTLIGGTGKTVTAVLATAPAAALVPTKSGGTGAAVTSVLATAPATGLVPTLSAGTGAAVTSVLATSPAAALVPTLSGGTGASVTATLATSPAAALVPGVLGKANVTSVLATSAAAALVPTLAAGTGAEVTSVLATATSVGLVPTLEGDANVTSVLATSPATGLVPTLSAGTGAGVTATLATSTATGLVPTLEGDASVTSVIATAPSTGLVPTLAAGTGASVTDVIATAPATGLVPTIEGDANVTSVIATAPAAALIPTLAAGTGASTSATLATATALALAATLSGKANITASLATAPSAALIPTLSAGTGAHVTSVIATAPSAALIPTLSGNALVSAITAAAIAAGIIPTPTAGTGATVTATKATATAAALIPTITTPTNAHINAVLATSLASAIAPTLRGDALINAILATSFARALVPDVTIFWQGDMAAANASVYGGALGNSYVWEAAYGNSSVISAIPTNATVDGGDVSNETVTTAIVTNR